MYKIKPIKVSEILKIINGKLYGNDTLIEYISTDSREEIKENTAYIAICGDKFNGNDFIEEAINKGCNLIISNKAFNLNVSIIVVEDTKIALGLLSKELTINNTKIAITGSIGKTTVKNMVSLVLKEKFSVVSTYKNENNEIGVPITLLRGIESDFTVVEMGMRGLGQISYLSSICNPEVSIITNVGTSHLELLKTKENIYKAKTEILEYTKRFVIVPYDYKFINQNYEHLLPIFVGKDVKYCDLEYTNNGMKFSCLYFNEKINGFELPGYNIGNVNNALFAITVGKIYSIPNNMIVNGINKFSCENMHGETLNINGITFILDCYNASYESVKSAMISLKKYAEINNKIPYLLLGDMLEIGEKSSEYHYRIGEYAKDLEIKNVYTIGKYGKDTLDGYLGGKLFNDKKELSKEISKYLGKDDVILVKGSREMKLESVVEQIKEYNG